MATAVTSQKLGSIMAVESYDHDPGATTAVVLTNGTTERWVAMRDFGAVGVIAKPTVVAAGGLTLLEIVAATDSTGTDETLVLASATLTANGLDEYAWLEVTQDQIKECGVAAGKNFTHVSARLTMATATDEACVTIIRALPKRAYANLTASSFA